MNASAAHRIVAAALLLLLAAAPSEARRAQRPSTPAHTPLVYAVVVGHNDGWGVLPQLRYADDDALRFYKLATRLTPSKNVALLTELDVETWRRLQLANTTPPPYLPPTKRRLEQVLALFKRQVAVARRRTPGRPVHLYFFYSGHGEKGYFLLKKAGASAIKGASPQIKGAFTSRDLQRAFAGSKATLNGLFIDACKSQSLFTAKGPSADSELGPDFSKLIAKVERTTRQLPIGVLTSTMSNRPAGEARDIGGGYFSHVLISGLAGAADANSDGVVRYGELAAFVSFHTRRISGQRPWFRPPRGKMKAPLVWLTGRRDLLEMPPGFAGHFAIFDAKSGTLRMEVHKTANQWTRLILEPGRYKVVWVRSRSVGLMARVTLDGKKPARLMRRSFLSQVALSTLGLARGARRLTRRGPGSRPARAPTSSAASAPTSTPTSTPASSPTALAGLPDDDRVDVDRTIAAFDPGSSGFAEPFSPRVVEMLEMAYNSGLTALTPVFARRSRDDEQSGTRPNQLQLAYGYLGAPARPYEDAHGVALAYTRELALGPGSLSLGARGLYTQSRHAQQQNNEQGFTLHRFALQAEVGYRYAFGARFSLGAALYGGWQLVMLVKREPAGGDESRLVTTLSGDATALRAGALLTADLRLGAGWSLTLAGGFGVDSLTQAGDREGFWRPQLMAGVGYAF
jgi:hypothetical protein